jgi:hypothetical protein
MSLFGVSKCQSLLHGVFTKMQSRIFTTLLLTTGFIGAPQFSSYGETDEPSKSISSPISSSSADSTTTDRDLFIRLGQVGNRLEVVISDCDTDAKRLADEVKRLSSAKDEVQKVQERSLCVMEKMRDVIKSRGEYVVVNSQAYTKAEVAEALKVTIAYYHKAVEKEAEYQRKLVEAQRKHRESLVRLEKWKAEEDRLDGVVSALRVSHQERRNNSDALASQELAQNANGLIEALEKRINERESATKTAVVNTPSANQSAEELPTTPVISTPNPKVANGAGKDDSIGRQDPKALAEAMKTVEAFDKEFQLKAASDTDSVSSPN